jgi:hypothetical protein
MVSLQKLKFLQTAEFQRLTFTLFPIIMLAPPRDEVGAQKLLSHANHKLFMYVIYSNYIDIIY